MMVKKIENARERFERAAIKLFRERGYGEVTVPQIAAAAGLTERTFFRYFVDKSEVLFSRAQDLEAQIVVFVTEAEDATRPLELVLRALETTGNFFDGNTSDVLARQAIVAAHADFQERELLKMRSLAVAACHALMQRGVGQHQALMASEVGVLIWRIAIEQWCESPSTGFSHYLLQGLRTLKFVVAD